MTRIKIRDLSLLVLLTSWPIQALNANTIGSEADGLVTRWTAVEQQRTALQSSWNEKKMLGEQQLKLLQAEEQELRAFLANNAQSSGELSERRATLIAEQAELERRQEDLKSYLPVIVERLNVMEARLPPPLAADWQKNPAADEQATVGETLSWILQRLTSASEFGKRIAIHRTVMTVNDREQEVEQVYLGLSLGWYVSTDNTQFGFGQPGQEAWRWQDGGAMPGLTALQIRNLIEQARSPATLEFSNITLQSETPSP